MDARAVLVICPSPTGLSPINKPLDSWSCGSAFSHRASPCPQLLFPSPCPSAVIASRHWAAWGVTGPCLLCPALNWTDLEGLAHLQLLHLKRCGRTVEEGIGFLADCDVGNLISSCMSDLCKQQKTQRSGSISCSLHLPSDQTKEILVTNTLETIKKTPVSTR